MTITLISPAGRIGQGMQFRVTSDIVTADAIFAQLIEPISGAVLSDSQYNPAAPFNPSAGTSQLTLGLYNNDGTFEPGNFIEQGMPDGTAVTLFIEYLSGGGPADSHTFAGFTFDPVSGITGLLSGISQGLTSSQEDILNTINQNTQAGAFKFPFIGVTTVVGAAENPVNGGQVIDMIVPGIPGAQVVGLTWEAITIPDVGVGTVGVIQEAARRVLQAVVFHSLAGGLSFADQVENTTAVTGAFFFDSWDPSGVSVYVWPGFILNFSWLIFP